MQRPISRFESPDVDSAPVPPRPGMFARSPVPRPASRVVFLYRGTEGPPPQGCGSLYKARPVFRAAVHECWEQLPNASQQGQSPEDLLTGVGLMSLFALQYAATRLLHSWGVAEDERHGHRLGDAIADCIHGRSTIAQALDRAAKMPESLVVVPSGDRSSGNARPMRLSCERRLFVEIAPPMEALERGSFDDSTDAVRLPMFGDPASEKSRLWRCVAALYAHGVNIDWQAFYGKPPCNTRHL